MASTTSSTSLFVVCSSIVILLLANGGVVSAAVDYGAALTKSLLFYEAQRSGKLPPNQRVQWRADSAMSDGSDAGVDLVGGYYDSGDHVKYGLPMAFAVTMLSWSAVEFGTQLRAKKELSNTLEAIKWGTDYFLKAHARPNLLYGQVGEGYSDHDCWQRPEDMTTPRTSYKIDEQHPGSDLAAETSAAFAAASIAFKKSNATYSSLLLTHAQQLYDFARNYRGKYQDSITVAGNFYSSSGYEDELLWAATWLHRATLNKIYLMNLETPNNGGTRTLFSWDDKYVGAQVLAAKLVLEGKVVQNFGNWANYKIQAEQYICNCVQRGSNNVRKTSGGLLWWQQPFNALQYTTSSLLVITAYSKYLTAAKSTLQCSAGQVSPKELITFAKSQVDYILGQNPKHLSYMVGIGSNYPQKIHHRGSSIVSIKKDNTPVSCKGGYDWYNKDTANPNVLDGAIVGGPDENDNYFDSRSNFNQAQPTTVNNAPIIGVLARLAGILQ